MIWPNSSQERGTLYNLLICIEQNTSFILWSHLYFCFYFLAGFVRSLSWTCTARALVRVPLLLQRSELQLRGGAEATASGKRLSPNRDSAPPHRRLGFGSLLCRVPPSLGKVSRLVSRLCSHLVSGDSDISFHRGLEDADAVLWQQGLSQCVGEERAEQVKTHKSSTSLGSLLLQNKTLSNLWFPLIHLKQIIDLCLYPEC